MRICMVLYDMQGCGVLEKYAIFLAFGLKQKGRKVIILSSAY
jgi:hypothetical protein